MTAKPRVYSYLRFSDPKQAAGNSADRQLEYAARWAAERKMDLDASLSLRDEGLSAYHQRHVKQGALGVFLRAVEDGRIPSGSVLVVEGLDRLSRAEPIQAQAQLAQIVNAGITVVTASDGREYSRKELKADPMHLVYSLLVMIRAHEESDTKSKRVKSAIRRQCEGWVAGTYRGVVRNGTDPQWTVQVGDRFELVPERVRAVRTMIDLFKKGHGSVETTRRLTERGLFIAKGGNHSTHIYRQIRNRALIGEKTLELDGETYRLKGYYPPILSAEEFADLQYLADKRTLRKGKGKIPSVITGLGITTCGYCGGAMVSQNAIIKRAKGKHEQDSWNRRLTCATYKHNTGCPVAGTCKAAPIELALMRYCSDKFNLAKLLEGDDGNGGTALASNLARARQQATELETQIQRITDALLSDDGPAPAAFTKRARELEAQLDQQRKVVETLEHQIASTAKHATPATAQAWADLVEEVDALDYDSRMKARQLVADTFSKIVIFMRGFNPPKNPHQRKGSIGLQLITKFGGSRRLEIDRQTGAWETSEDLDVSGDIPLPPDSIGRHRRPRTVFA
jgi:DNA invertase Pin-like site-specific DNA recombinase